MIKNIFSLLRLREYQGDSELIDVAKGKYKIPATFIEAYKQFRRELAWQ